MLAKVQEIEEEIAEKMAEATKAVDNFTDEEAKLPPPPPLDLGPVSGMPIAVRRPGMLCTYTIVSADPPTGRRGGQQGASVHGHVADSGGANAAYLE